MPRGLKYALVYVFSFPMMILIALFDGSTSVDQLYDVNFWIWMLIAYHAFWAIFLYFTVVNPRRFIMLTAWQTSSVSVGWIAKLVGFILLVLAWLGVAFFLAVVVEPISLKAVLLVTWIVALLIGIYFLFYRGIGIYKNGKIRVFHYGITTIRSGEIENVTIEPYGNRAILHVRISGTLYDFKLPTDVANLACKRITKTFSHIQEQGFDDD